MIQKEPIISVGIVEGLTTVDGAWEGEFNLTGGKRSKGNFTVRSDGGQMVVYDRAGGQLAAGREIACTPVTGGSSGGGALTLYALLMLFAVRGLRAMRKDVT